MKQTLSIITALGMILALSACGDSRNCNEEECEDVLCYEDSEDNSEKC